MSSWMSRDLFANEVVIPWSLVHGPTKSSIQAFISYANDCIWWLIDVHACMLNSKEVDSLLSRYTVTLTVGWGG